MGGSAGGDEVGNKEWRVAKVKSMMSHMIELSATSSHMHSRRVFSVSVPAAHLRCLRRRRTAILRTGTPTARHCIHLFVAWTHSIQR